MDLGTNPSKRRVSPGLTPWRSQKPPLTSSTYRESTSTLSIASEKGSALRTTPTIFPALSAKIMSSGITVFFIQNSRCCGALKTKIIPASSSSCLRYIRPYSRLAAVSAISTLTTARRAPLGATISIRGPCAQALNAIVKIESAPIAAIATAPGFHEKLVCNGVTAANLANHGGRRSPRRLRRDLLELAPRGLGKGRKHD